MAKIKATTDRLLAELNTTLQSQWAAAASNPFVNSPAGASGLEARGISSRGLWTPEHQKAFNDVFSRFELDDEA